MFYIVINYQKSVYYFFILKNEYFENLIKCLFRDRILVKLTRKLPLIHASEAVPLLTPLPDIHLHRLPPSGSDLRNLVQQYL